VTTKTFLVAQLRPKVPLKVPKFCRTT